MVLQETATWDARLVRGIGVAGIAPETGDTLIAALGALGCEAEYGQTLLHISDTVPRPTHSQGEQWLRQCANFCQRLMRLSTDFEIAAQGYLTALARIAANHPLRAGRDGESTTGWGRDSWSAQFDATPDVWWPERGDIAVESESLELWLRRAGFSYRQSVESGLPEHIEAMTEALHLVLHALRTLPPSGVVTHASLALGLQTLSATFEGDLVPHHLLDLDERHVGLVTALAAIARLDPAEARLEVDIAWARGELDQARLLLQDHRGPGRVTRPLTPPTGNLWARQLVAEWEHTLAQLEALRS
jgi:hypothetical protein